MSQFEDFERHYGPPQDRLAPPPDAIRTYERVLPPELLAHWRAVGWCSYGNGLLWLVDPAQFADVIDEWVGPGTGIEAGAPVVFLRSAFAHLYLWHEGSVYSLDVQRGGIARVTQHIQRIFALLCDPEIAEKILRASLYARVLPLLGPPERDECYGFEPALVLGGPGTAETVRRVKIREHLGILAQLVR